MTDCALSDPRDDAEAAGLRYVCDQTPGFSRLQAEEGFVYRRANGAALTDERHLARIRALAIPPAWTQVWICPQANGHLQATGRDAKGRKQYRYHPEFRAMRESAKFEHILQFARALPAIRERVARDMARRDLSRPKVLATVAHLLEATLIRVGNDDYVEQNQSFGLTTLRNRHVCVEGGQVRFEFRGKSGKKWSLTVNSRRVAKIIRSCQELPGQELLQYVGDDGEVHAVSSSDVNEYLREISGMEISAKDFRTWAGTVLAAAALRECSGFASAAEAKRNIKAAVQKVAARLGNTPTICRKCYIHPEILNGYVAGELAAALTAVNGAASCDDLLDLPPEEAAVMGYLASRVLRAAESSSAS